MRIWWTPSRGALGTARTGRIRPEGEEEEEEETTEPPQEEAEVDVPGCSPSRPWGRSRNPVIHQPAQGHTYRRRCRRATLALPGAPERAASSSGQLMASERVYDLSSAQSNAAAPCWAPNPHAAPNAPLTRCTCRSTRTSSIRTRPGWARVRRREGGKG